MSLGKEVVAIDNSPLAVEACRRRGVPWFDYLFLSHDELETLLKGTGWGLRTVEDEPPVYVAVIKKQESS
jgi:hypothetical protein